MEFTGQVLAFAITIVTGILLGLLFDCYRVLRGTFNPRSVVTSLTDLLYWLIATAVVFAAVVLSNWGELRFYVFFGILSGLGLYYKWLSLYSIRMFSMIIRLIIAGLSLLKRIFIGVVVRPGRYCIRMAIKPITYSCRRTTVWWRTRWPKPPEDEEK
ncbi:MAG: spore cortex biosynthesis protein YabQ [Sporomusaceae bacterium]|nr:spore cortex biosynthesis protein YabQ [Sporomusaceae bacterium]